MQLESNMLKFYPVATIMIAACAVSACGSTSLVSPYQRPQVEAAVIQAPAAGVSVDWLVWWKSFQDPVLDALLQEAADQSQDLALASARIEEARATLRQTQSSRYPTLDLTGSANRSSSSENSANSNPGANRVSTDFQLGLTASYEIDFWGKFARADDASRARLLGQTASRGAVLTTLYANVAESYFALRALDAQLILGEKTLAAREETLRLQQSRFTRGVSGELDLRQAQAEAASAQATMLVTKQNRSNAESALALLLGRTPAGIIKPNIARGAEVAVLYAAPAIPSNLPSDVLTARPDLISSEQALIAANADIAQARTAYFPSLALTAGVGLQSKDLSNLFDPASMFWNLLGNLTQPIFRGGAIDAVVAASNARQQQALAQYTQAVQSAFRDVHDALNNVESGREITQITNNRIAALQGTLRLAQLRYTGGYSSYLEVLSAQRDLNQAESALIDTQRAHLNAVVSLYKALGGGWDAKAMRE
jgi:outer membrane protein, multidrug efflux system